MKYSPIFTGDHAFHVWSILNIVMFDSTLKVVPLFTHPQEIDQGLTYALFYEREEDESCGIKIARSCVNTPEDYAKLMAHEMVHQWQWENGYELDHGALFRSKCRRIHVLTGINPK